MEWTYTEFHEDSDVRGPRFQNDNFSFANCSFFCGFGAVDEKPLLTGLFAVAVFRREPRGGFDRFCCVQWVSWASMGLPGSW